MNRSDHKTLDVNARGTVIFKAGAELSEWRVVEAWSERGLPFELILQWTLGCGPGQQARVSVSHATRVCVCAQDIVLAASNRANEKHAIGVAVVNGFMPTTNYLDEWAECDGTTPVQLIVPPFAQRFDLQLQQRHLLSSTAVKLYSGTGQYMELRGDAIPVTGIAIGSTDFIEILTPVSMVLRGIFSLGL